MRGYDIAILTSNELLKVTNDDKRSNRKLIIDNYKIADKYIKVNKINDGYNIAILNTKGSYTTVAEWFKGWDQHEFLEYTSEISIKELIKITDIIISKSK